VGAERHGRRVPPGTLSAAGAELGGGHGRHEAFAETKGRDQGEVFGRADERLELGVERLEQILGVADNQVYLKDNPGDYETVRRMLGHKSLTTTLKYYVNLETRLAALHFDRNVLNRRQAARVRITGRR
jgi:hypothetical protein